MLEIDIDQSKLSRDRNSLKYSLRNADVFESEGGFHFTGYFDQLNESVRPVDPSSPTDDVRVYIEKNLQANPARYSRHLELAQKYVPTNNVCCLDVGCGGGLFLSELKSRGSTVCGIEPNEDRAQYARTEYNINVSTLPIENDYWQRGRRNSFDLITFWDVIEHVNLPYRTLGAAFNLLKPGGFLMLDTPCKDGFYYRFGETSYRITRGRSGTLLEAMYKNEPFGHKQIFSTNEMRGMLVSCGFDCVSTEKIHELSFPIAHYFRRLRLPNSAAIFLGSTVGWLVRLIRVRNKMVVVAQKHEMK